MTKPVSRYVDTGFVTIPGATTVDSALARLEGADWAVITGEEELPLGVVSRRQLVSQPPGATLDHVASRVPGFVVVPGEATLFEAARSPLVHNIREAGVGTVLVLSGDEIVGLLGRWPLRGVMVLGSLGIGGGRASGATLPGPIRIGYIVKTCGFSSPGGDCLASRQFPRRPPQMPDCENPRGLAPHTFVWR